jgi:protein-S-isoprenylcysteine O-methyltransferase Ste14
VRTYIRHLSVTALWLALCFGGAGRLDWTRGWICTAVYVPCTAITGVLVLRFNPEVIRARARWKRAEIRRFDRLFFAIFFPLTLLLPLLGGLDAARFGWLVMPPWTLVLGIAACLISAAIVTSALLNNPFAETTVRLQSDRGHRVVSTGPYRIVRHPMYVGLILLYPSLACMLGSGCAAILSAVIGAAIVWRTAQEDRFLEGHLDGYAQYAARTRFRLVPGLW